MATETLRPDGVGAETSILYQWPDSDFHFDKVDEEEADGTTTHLYTNSKTYQRDLYALPASSGSGTINFIRIYFTVDRVTDTGAKAQPSLKSNDTVTDGTERTLTETWVTWSQAWSANPAPPGTDAWTWDDIDALQIGVSLKTPAGNQARCTQVYVEVDYTPPPPPVPVADGDLIGIGIIRKS